MSRETQIEYINDHRTACDYEPLPATMTDEEIAYHMNLIDEHAPFGNDPWDESNH